MASAFRLPTFVIAAGLAGILGMLLLAPERAAARQTGKKPAGDKPRRIDPWRRPEGSIVDQSMRYYLWYDDSGWHLRSCAKTTRNFHGTLRVENGTVKSCLPVGLKERSKTGDAWTVNGNRTELKFNFSTSLKSDGLDIQIDGDDAKLEFDLHIDQEQGPRLVYIGRNEQHPPKNPFTLPAAPPKPTK